MKFIYLLIYQFGFLSALLGCDKPSPKRQELSPPYYKQFEGSIGNRTAVLNLMKTGQSSNMLFVGYFYYTDDLLPVFFEGSHFFYPINTDIANNIIVDNYAIEQSMLDTLQYTSDNIDLLSAKGRFTGNFKSDSTFVGTIKLKNNEELPFQFKESINRNNIDFDIGLLQKDTFLNVGVNRNAKVKWSLDLARPMLNKQMDAFLQKAIFKQLTHCDNLVDNLAQINPCVSHVFTNRFEEFKTWKFNWFKFESIVLPMYSERKILSFLCLDNYDTDRRDGCRSSTFSYNIEKKQTIKFDDVFKNGSKDKIFNLIKKSNRYNQAPSIFNENNFYITHKRITFMVSDVEANRYSKTGQEFTYTFDEIKDMIEPSFWDILK